MSQSPTEKDIFRIASNIESEEVRAEYLNQVCGDNAGLRSRLEVLLRVSRDETDFLTTPPISFDPTETREWPPSEQPGETIGPYRLCKRIGEGGFGVVYAAEQTHPISRKVALKIIKPGMDSQEVIARFNAERQTLALMDHPHIARVLDAGRAQNGRPYFVMELVEGVPITEFCDVRRMTIEQRLRLLADVCRAVQHAHQKGIIHRDLKPSNVLVMTQDGTAVAKVIDFGIAKALSGRLTSDSVYTVQGQMIGTPMYMSPEQAPLSGLDVDTRSDIYSLGVLLYELLTGTPPLEREQLEGHGSDQMQRILRDSNPLKPSSRLNTTSAEQRAGISDRRQIEDRQLIQLLRGELDWIVMKALEKDRNRRYESAAGLADDIERFLAGDAIIAGPPSPTYRLRKLAYRYRGLLASVLLVFLALAVGLVTALLQRQAAITARAQVEHTLEQVRLQKERAEVLAYAADIRAASQALDRGDVLDAFETLNRQRPAEGQSDHRGIEWSLLMRRAQGTSSTNRLSDKPLYAMCVSPDGSHLVVGGADGAIYVLDAASLRLERTFDSSQIEVNGLSFSVDGRTLVSTGDDGTVRLWEFPSGKPQQTIPLGAERSYAALITPDGRSLIACGNDADVRIFSLPDGKRVKRLAGHERSVHQLAFSPDGHWLASVSSDGHMCVWDWRRHRREFRSTKRSGRLSSVAFSPDGRWLVESSLHGEVLVTDAKTWKHQTTFQLGDAVQEIAITADSGSIAAVTRAGTLHRLPLGTGSEVQEDPAAVPGRQVHTGRVYDAVWSDAQTLLSVGEDGYLGRTVRVEPQTPRFAVPEESEKPGIAVSPDGSRIAWTNRQQIGLHDLSGAQEVPLPEAPTAEFWSSLAFSPDGRTIFAGNMEGELVLIPVDGSREIITHPLAGGRDPISPRFSADGRRLALIGYERDRVFVLGLPQFEAVFRLPPAVDTRVIDLTSDGSVVAFNRGRDLLVYAVDTGERLARSSRHHKEAIVDLRFLPGGEQLVTIGAAREIRLWNWRQQDALPELVGIHPEGRPLQLQLSHDGRTLISSADRGELVLWCLPARQRLFSIGLGPGTHQSVDLAADGSVLAVVTSSQDVHWLSLEQPSRSIRPARVSDGTRADDR